MAQSEGPERQQRRHQPVGWRGLVLIACLAIVLAATLLITARLAVRHGHVVELTLLQMNDVYEINPLAGSDQGGLARVASLRKQLLAENPNTYTLLAGDLLSPSAMGNIVIDGEPLAGRQMVDVLKHTGVDLVTLGNHEFDLKQTQLEARLAEGAPRFQWLSANVRRSDGTAFPHVRPNTTFSVKNGADATIRIGVFGLTIKTSKANDYVVYESPLATAVQQVAELRPKVDVLVAMTHLSMDEDREIAAKVPGIDLIIGGHEHENAQALRGPALTPIVKADANARTVYVHRLRFDTRTRQLVIESMPRRIDAGTPADPAVDKVAREWTERAHAALRDQGFAPQAIVATSAPSLDGTEASVRNQPTNLTRLIADGMLQAVPTAEIAIFNSGSIRIDDTIPAGKLAEWDAFRILPYPGTLELVQIDGRTLKDVLDANHAKRGTGNFLQTAKVEQDTKGGWFIAGKPLVPTQTYRVAVNDFVLRGEEAGFPMLKPSPPRVSVEQSKIIDVRRALIEAMRRL